MKTYVAYVRVSCAKQELGASLAIQRAEIGAYARAQGLSISRWLEEVESASQPDRPQFNAVVDLLSRGSATGLIIHKVDRGARNLRDWAALGELIDQGIDVRFAHDDLRLDSRGGRLAADIQAVIAADYIRNLREETRKGIQGRLRQGLYPWPAPIGYIDRGGGRPKLPHPAYARLVAEAFHLYASGGYSLRTLRDEMAARGLTNTGRRQLTKNDLWRMLHNPFYAGTIRLRAAATEYVGMHKAIVSKELFDEAQRVFASRRQRRGIQRRFAYSRRISHVCGLNLVGEMQKGRVYYRCHACRGVCLREDWLDRLLSQEVRVSSGVCEIGPSLRG